MESSTKPKHLNRLANEKSPYLLQHKNNPVDWYPWGEEAFKKARDEDKLIFLSVGYSTCHWCHVMAHESFENETIAKLMNDKFVNVKVDREERPDIDKIYMTFVQATTGGGGWPMSVWLTPKLHPVVGGTYFPPKDMMGRKGFPSILKDISNAWVKQKSELEEQGTRVTHALRESITSMEEISDENMSRLFTPETITRCYEHLSRKYDPIEGGFTNAPKFPHAVIFNLLALVASKHPKTTKEEQALRMLLHTLRKMGDGGIFDHLGGGFHRYSVDAQWHVPHFEKMLYDQSQNVNSYLDAFLFTRESYYKQKAQDVLDYVLRVLCSPEGGFYSAEDADSFIEHGKPEHAEGAFYVWEKTEIDEILGDEAKVFNLRYGVKQAGNAPPGADPHQEFQGKNILIARNNISDIADHLKMSEEQVIESLDRSKAKLFQVREKRPHPHMDDKIITSWNGLMISAFARAGIILDNPKYLQAAEKAVKFIRTYLFDSSTGQLLRNYREGPSSVHAFADDYAFLIQGLLDLYESTFNLEWLKWAIQLQEKQNELFWDVKGGGYFAAKEGDSSLVLRMKDDQDGAEPCNNSVSALNLLRLSSITSNTEWKDYAKKTFTVFSNLLVNSPVALPQMCVALDFFLSTPKQIIIAGEKDSPVTQAMLKEVHSSYISNRVIILVDDEGRSYLESFLPEIKDMNPVGDKTTAYVCENFTCKLPVTSVEELKELLQPKTK